jgi:UDPglucose 6-dehydrogenase
MHVGIIGSGYVGLVTGACLAETGNDVVCMDKDADLIASLKTGRIPFHEPGLAPLVQKNQAEGRLMFTTDLPQAVRHARVIFLAVGTPARRNG